MDPYDIWPLSFFHVNLFNLSLFCLGCTFGVVEHDAAYFTLMILSGVGEMKKQLISAYDPSSSFSYFLIFPHLLLFFFFVIWPSFLPCCVYPYPMHLIALSLLLLLTLNSAVFTLNQGDRTGKGVCVSVPVCCFKGCSCLYVYAKSVCPDVFKINQKCVL